MGVCCTSKELQRHEVPKAGSEARGPDSDDEIDQEKASAELPLISPPAELLLAKYGPLDPLRGDPGIAINENGPLPSRERTDDLEPEQSADPAFISRGPTMQGVVEPCILGPEISFFRIADGWSWALYNDSLTFEIEVLWTFLSKRCKQHTVRTRVRALGSTKLVSAVACDETPPGFSVREGPFARLVFSVHLDPGETKRFVRLCTGKTSFLAYEYTVTVTPQTPESCKLIKIKADRRFEEQSDAMALLGATQAADALRISRLQKVSYVDLGFRATTRCLVRSAGSGSALTEDEARVATLGIVTLFDNIALVCFRRPEECMPRRLKQSMCAVREPCLSEREPFGTAQSEVSLTHVLHEYFAASRHRKIGVAQKADRVLPMYLRVRPSSFGNSWLACALAIVAERPIMIQRVLASSSAETDMQIGAHCVTLCLDGCWTPVFVDSFLPYQGNSMLCMQSQMDPAELWPSIIEKAFAKFHFSYANIIIGDTLSAIHDLCGYPVQRFDKRFAEEQLKTLTAEEEDPPESMCDLFSELHDIFRNKSMIHERPPKSFSDNMVFLRTATSDEASPEVSQALEDCGLRIGHTYAVVDMRYFPTHRKKLVRVRLPWPAVLERRQMLAASGVKDLASLERYEEARPDRWRGDWSWGSLTWSDPSFIEIANDCGVNAGRAGVQPVPDELGRQTVSLHSTNVKSSKDGVSDICPMDPARDDVYTSLWMDWRDIMRYFSGASVCHVRPVSYEYRFAGSFSTAGLPSFALEVTCKRGTIVTLTLSQPGRKSSSTNPTVRSRRQTRNSVIGIAEKLRKEVKFHTGSYSADVYVPIHLVVCRPDVTPGLWLSHLSASTDLRRPSEHLEFIQQRQISTELYLAPSSRPYLIVARCLALSQSRPFSIGLFSTLPVDDVAVSIRFVALPAQCPLFDGLAAFSYDPGKAEVVSVEWQHRRPLSHDSRVSWRKPIPASTHFSSSVVPAASPSKSGPPPINSSRQYL